MEPHHACTHTSRTTESSSGTSGNHDSTSTHSLLCKSHIHNSGMEPPERYQCCHTTAGPLCPQIEQTTITVGSSCRNIVCILDVCMVSSAGNSSHKIGNPHKGLCYSYPNATALGLLFYPLTPALIASYVQYLIIINPDAVS